jgi:hypothetical protein
VQKKESEPEPEEPDGSPGSFQIVVSSAQFEWLTKQSEFMGITKQQLVVGAVEEWICRNGFAASPYDPSITAQTALDEFLFRHRDEFLWDADET